MLWDLIERVVGGREFHRVGPEFLKALEYREVLLEFRELSRGAIYRSIYRNCFITYSMEYFSTGKYIKQVYLYIAISDEHGVAISIFNSDYYVVKR